MDRVKSVVCDEIEASVAKISAITSLVTGPWHACFASSGDVCGDSSSRTRGPCLSACSPCDVYRFRC